MKHPEKSSNICYTVQKQCIFEFRTVHECANIAVIRKYLMLSNECLYMVANIGFDTAEIEPSKIWGICLPPTPSPGSRIRSRSATLGKPLPGAARSPMASSRPTPQGQTKHLWRLVPKQFRYSRKRATCRSFSAVSAPIFATKYAFCDIFKIFKKSS